MHLGFIFADLFTSKPMHLNWQNFLIRNWKSPDREIVAKLISQVLAEYGLGWEPEGADRDVLWVEEYYLHREGEFWVVEQNQQIVGTGAYYPIQLGHQAVEIRKMYLSPEVRGCGLGKFLLTTLEKTAASRGFRECWVETASVLKEAVQLYEKNGYVPATGVETKRCDRIYVKSLDFGF